MSLMLALPIMSAIFIVQPTVRYLFGAEYIYGSLERKNGRSMLKSIVASALLTLFCIGLAFGADKRSFRPGTKPGGNYNQDIVMDGTLYVSGQGGEDSAGKIPNDFDAEVRQSLENNGAVLKAAGMTSADFVSVQVYLADGAKFQRMNSGYTSYFKEPRPTRTTVVVSRLVGPGNIEITVIAKK